ncbi:MATE family efflux transporter [Christensenellaceae bacterium OttesenSCG-928-K19]|nr:MATE family efflux transporter [Christensenellaceae bacterium OttesenSCG-928-K19]
MNTQAASRANPLGTEKIGKLILKYSVPAIISMVVNALYNIVDQIVIGQGVGMLGNAATNVAFPLTTISTALALLIGIGSASNFNLRQGEGKSEEAMHFAGGGYLLSITLGAILGLVAFIFLDPMLLAFGATENVMPYAQPYTAIICLGLPFMVFATVASHLIRADGSPKYAMGCVLAGAIFNVVFDPIFMFVFDMGIEGVAWATTFGQILSSAIAFAYLFRYKNASFKKEHFRLKGRLIKSTFALGSAACFNQLAITVVQIALNNVLTYYGAMSIYGSDIPLAAVGVLSKVNILYISIVIGVAQGCQPINGYNYGAKNFARVKQTYKTAAIAVLTIGVISFILFQIFPRQITAIFGTGSEEYFRFAERYFRIFMFATFINGIQPLTANFFTSIGKAHKGIFISLTRQILFLLPLVLILPIFLGIDGVMYSGPIADGIASVVAILFIYREMKEMTRLQQALGNPPAPA